MSEEPRHEPGWDVTTGRMKFLQQIGDYDLWWDRDEECYSVVQDPLTCTNSHNYTDYRVMPGKGDTFTIEPEDNDVILDPYHMCLLYAACVEISKE